MTTCSVKFLKAVDGHPVGRVIAGVQRDSLIDKWADMGLIEVKDDTPPQPEETAAPDGAPETGETAPVAADDGDPAPEGGVPPTTARKAVWRDFLDGEGIDYPTGATKADMIEAWEQERADG